MTYRFTTSDALSLLESSDGDYDDGIDAFVDVVGDEKGTVVELTTTEDDEWSRTTERFRVTVERIGDDR